MVAFLINPCRAEKKSAGKAMLFCLLPGGGQFYTERYIPGVIIGAGEITLGYLAYKNHSEKKYAERNSFLWWELFLFGYSLADAYVGAKMYNFDVECNIDKVSLLYRIKF
ncbi:MAG: hypothetical protein N3A65_06210 [candidate division WOR-3 bacterium]|nr:hypothetical protein [candidate division WOR-3 bacterium]